MDDPLSQFGFESSMKLAECLFCLGLEEQRRLGHFFHESYLQYREFLSKKKHEKIKDSNGPMTGNSAAKVEEKQMGAMNEQETLYECTNHNQF